MSMTRTTQSYRGFTLVETLIAIAILMIAIVGPYYSIQRAIMASYAARDQLIASSLAQEGVEYIYFMRDNNYLSGQAWLTGMNACTGAYGCTVDPTQSTSLAACNSGGCPAIKLSDTGIYTHTGNYPVTRFVRTVKVQSISATQVKVTVLVAWSTEHQNYTVNVEENLYNWL
jgi:prepilin-type N-terminal cleavage/methylation domain-containing protein